VECYGLSPWELLQYLHFMVQSIFYLGDNVNSQKEILKID